jgi:DNA-directed RNA polymerase subunit K/omega
MDIARRLFAREVDFKIETTENSYAACRALSIRARHRNSRFRDLPEGAVDDSNNPTVGALKDYSRGRIVLSENEEEAAAE